ncbi:hypothetical protein CAEBREN_21261 [Caenorhabditis brenneri]|uniref:Uncharacterized protein n=1 Tax=Caenorhabditis brenneri TaxID=135651 RepID=G0N6V5_CAEBE|nr:hypothetical protein CAEBREN_21261 [Caenorhabditis brenneri]
MREEYKESMDSRKSKPGPDLRYAESEADVEQNLVSYIPEGSWRSHHQLYGSTPNVDFLYQFAILYTKYNGAVGREQFHSAACNYLTRNSPQVGQKFFRRLSHGFQNLLTLQHMAVTFS